MLGTAAPSRWSVSRVEHHYGAAGNLAGQQDNGRFIMELAFQGDEVSLNATLPEQYYRAMGSDPNVFTLLYPGSESVPWGWGPIQDVARRALKEGLAGKMVVPGGARLNFKAHYFSEYATTDQPRSQPPALVEPSDRIPGTPYFTVAVNGPTSARCYEDIIMTLIFVYHGVTGTNGNLEESMAPPVTFHSYALTGSRAYTFQVQRRRRAESDREDWEDCRILEEYSCEWGIYDEPDLEVYVGRRDSEFTCLHPGESIEKVEWLEDSPDVSLPHDTMPGDLFRCRVKRAEVDWWDWDTMEEHRETAANLPCWVKGDVTEPKDYGGRPKVLVPASEWFEFTLLE